MGESGLFCNMILKNGDVSLGFGLVMTEQRLCSSARLIVMCLSGVRRGEGQLSCLMNNWKDRGCQFWNCRDIKHT